MLDKTRDQMNNWRWENPHAFGDEVDRSNSPTTISGKVKWTSKLFSWYGTNDPRAKIEPPTCRQYKPGDSLSVRQINWNEIIDKDEDDENWADPRALSGARSRPSDENDNNDIQDEEDTQGSVKEIRKRKCTKDGTGKGMGKARENGKGKGSSKGKGIIKQP
jgi:hypothetical protein